MHCPSKNPEEAVLLLDYCENRLPFASVKSFEEHLAGCLDCRAFVEEQSKLSSLLEQWPLEPISRDFNAKLYAKMDKTAKPITWWRALLGRLAQSSAMPPVAAAVVMGIALLLLAPSMTDTFSVETVDANQVEMMLDDIEMLDQMAEASEAQSL
jgi:hypothetical protein